MNGIPGQLLLQLILIMLNAFFAATEISLLSLSTTKLRKLAEEGDKAAPRLLKLASEPSGFLSTIQVGITLAGFLGSAFASGNFSEYLVNWITVDLGVTSIPVSVLETLSVIVITIILSYFTLVLGELVPKRIAMQKPMQIARVASIVVSGIATVLKPVVWFLSFSTNLLLKLLRMKTEAEEETVTEDEIRMMVDLGGASGTIDEKEKEWIQNVFDFGDISVHEAMTRQSDIQGIPFNATRDEALHIIQESGRSRFPVYGKDINDIRGILTARAFLMDCNTHMTKSVKELIQPAYFVPETIHADQLFRDMQRRKIHMAIVVDEYGETAGLITMEDLLEEIVGNIYDEFDPAEPRAIEQLEENLWRISGSVDVETLAETLHIKLPKNYNYETLGGMVYSCLTSIPQDGSKTHVTVNGLSIQVEKITDRRIEKALVRKLPPAEAPAAE